MARAKPSCAICATRVASVFVSRALVATTPRVVFCAGRRRSEWRPPRSSLRASANVLPSAVAHAGDDLPVAGIDDVAERVDGHERRDDEAVRQRRAPALPMPPFMACAAPPPCRPWRRRRRRRCLPRPARSIAAVAAWYPQSAVGRMVPSPTGRSNSAAAGTIGTCAWPNCEADLLLLEIAHHAGRAVEAERAAARQHDRVRDLHEVDRDRADRFRGWPAPRRARRRAAVAPASASTTVQPVGRSVSV